MNTMFYCHHHVCLITKNLSTLYFFMLCILMTVMCDCGTRVEQEISTQSRVEQQVDVPSSQRDENTLYREISAEPPSLNPILTVDEMSAMVEELIFEPLLQVDSSPESNLVGRLAKNWQISDDHRTITFFLREGITWHDGKPFTANDVKFTFDLARNDNIPAIGMHAIIETIENIEILDKNIIQFTFKYPYSPGLVNVGRIFIVPKHLLRQYSSVDSSRESLDISNAPFNSNPVGTGPYRFQEWQKGKYVVLTKNTSYWDKQNYPHIDHVFYRILASQYAALNYLKRGELDVFRAKPLFYARFQHMPQIHDNFEIKQFFEPSFFYIGWNVRPDKKLFRDRRVRVAMTHALDRDTFIAKALKGMGSIVTGPYFFKSWAYNQKITPYPFDLEKTAQLLHEAGWKDTNGDNILDKDGMNFEFELLISNDAREYSLLAAMLHQSLKSVSVNMTVREVDWSIYLEKTQLGDFDACIGGWGLDVDPDPYEFFHSSQIDVGNNFIGYNNPGLDHLLEEGRRLFDRSQRQKIYYQIHQILHDEQPYTFAYISKETYIFSNRLTNFIFSPFGPFRFFPGILSWQFKKTDENNLNVL